MLAEFLIETSITMQRFSPGLQGCGSPIDVLTITADEGVRWLRRKASLPSRMPEATSLPIFWTQPQVRVSTSADPRRASSYTACR
jgi:hypothetical protein